jgi:hypothetical protein
VSRSYLEELRRLVLAETTKIGTSVANLHGRAAVGAAASASTGKSSAGSAQWSVVRTAGANFPSVDEFHQAVLASPSPSATTADAASGAVVVASQTSAATTVLLSGTISLDQPRTFPLAVDAGTPDAAYTITVDGRALRSGTGSTQLFATLAAGTHSIEVMGSTPTIGVKIPSDLQVTPGFNAVPTPVWQTIESGYADEGSGAPVNLLSWYADVRAGAWRVLRRELTALAPIADLSGLATNSEFVATLTGDVTQDLSFGMDLLAGPEEMGRVQALTYDADADTTSVRLRLAPGRVDLSDQWVGRTAFQGELLEATRVSRTGTPTASWTDAGVRTGVRYEYAIQAQSLSDAATWSPLSDLQSILTGDNIAPGSITFETGYPKVIAQLGRMKFTTPDDIDYAGVKVYYRKFYTGTVSSSTANTLTGAGGAFPVSVVGWTVRITSGTGKGQERAVTVSTSTDLTLAENWATNPPGGSSYIVFLDTPVKTEYGVPSRIEDGTFELIDTATTAPQQLYHFRSFDKAGNEESDQVCATWTFDPTSDPGTIGTIDCLVEGGDAGIQTGFKGDFQLDFDCTLVGWHLYCTDPDTGGDIAFDVKKCTFGAFPTMTSIVGTTAPALAAQTKNSDTTLSGWTLEIASGEILRVEVTSTTTTVVNCTLAFTIQRHSV